MKQNIAIYFEIVFVKRLSVCRVRRRVDGSPAQIKYSKRINYERNVDTITHTTQTSFRRCIRIPKQCCRDGEAAERRGEPLSCNQSDSNRSENNGTIVDKCCLVMMLEVGLFCAGADEKRLPSSIEMAGFSDNLQW